jgi:hypothetical protein
MKYRGRVINGKVLVTGILLAEGTEVTVAVPATRRKKSRKRRAILRLAGKARGLPVDAAENLDHYLYGLPRR